MGSEQSTSRSSRSTFKPSTRQDHVTKDYEKTQSERRQMYERKLVEEMTAQTANVAMVRAQASAQHEALPSNSTIRPRPEIKTMQSGDKTIEIKQPETTKSNQFLSNFNPIPSTRPKSFDPTEVLMAQVGSYFSQPICIIASPETQAETTEILERNRTPYNFTSNELPSALQKNKGQSIYPNLRHPVKESTNVPLRHPSNIGNDFVFVNSDRRTRCSPSAPPHRDRSQSSNRKARSNNNNRNDSNNNVSCRTCCNTFSLKIYQCLNGHSSCSNCYSNKALCGLCHLNITDMRNLMLEDYVSQQKIPCPNASDGCCLFIKMLDLENHMKECPFQELICPVNGTSGYCKWKGKISHLAEHFNSRHPTETQGEVNTELVLSNICFNSHTLYLITMGGTHNFLVHIKVSEMDRKVYMAVQLLGTTISASKWNYEIHVYNKREPRRKYQFTDICSSANTKITDLINESNCASLPLSYASTFINDGMLYYKFFIAQNQVVKTDFYKNRRGRGAFRGRH